MKTSKTYRDLLEELKGLTDEQLDCDITLMDEDEEFHGVRIRTEQSYEDDVLDAKHPYFVLEINEQT